MIRSSALVFGAGVAESILLLMRNVLLARLLTVSDFGIAATFSIIVVLMDVAQNAGINRMIVQARDGDDEHLQSALHSVQVALGCLTSLAIIVISWPFAAFMKTQELTWAYALLAVVPVLRGFGHLDVFRLQRRHRFGPSMVRQITPQVLSLIAVWPAYLYFGDYRAALAAIVVQQVGALIASHIGADRRFRLSWDRAIADRAFRFGLPLLLNGGLLYLVTNGDRMLVANLFGMDALGWFSAALLLTLNPVLLIARSLQTLFLPIMSRAQDDADKLRSLYGFVNNLVSFLVFVLVSGTALLGDLIVRLLYGPRYAAAIPLLLLLAIMQGIRLMRTVPSLPAMAVAETKNPLYTNLVRIGFIPASLLVGIWTRDLHLMIAVGIVGEVVSTDVAIRLLHRKVGLDTRGVEARLLFDTAALGGIAIAFFHPSLILFAVPAIISSVMHARATLQQWPKVSHQSGLLAH